jgi:hypothetical protein
MSSCQINTYSYNKDNINNISFKAIYTDSSLKHGTSCARVEANPLKRTDIDKAFEELFSLADANRNRDQLADIIGDG